MRIRELRLLIAHHGPMVFPALVEVLFCMLDARAGPRQIKFPLDRSIK